MKTKYITVLIASLLTLSGCKNETSFTNNPLFNADIEASLQAETKINFDILSTPNNPTLVIPTYLAVNAQDGTLNTQYQTADSTAHGSIMEMMKSVDGWSTSQFIKINFNGNSLDPNSAELSFHFLKTANPTSQTDTTAPLALQQGVDYTISVVGNTLTATFLKPLESSANYMFAVTNMLKDSKNNAVGMTRSYATIKSNIPAGSASLLTTQAITHRTENTFEQVGVDKSTIIFSSWFTTTSIGDALLGAKSTTAQALKNGASTVWQGSAIAKDISPAQLNSLFTMTPPILSGTTKLSKADVYKGQITLPYYLDSQADKFLTSPWESGMPSLAKIRYVLTQGSAQNQQTIRTQLNQLGIDPQQLLELDGKSHARTQMTQALTGAVLSLEDGSQLDAERIITRDSTIPMLKSVQTFEYTLVLPKKAECQQPASNAVTIYQHGITSDKETLTRSFLADQLIGDSCLAIIAINHPLHGDRGIAGQNAKSNPLIYLNLSSFTVARDNVRQSNIDVINLRATIGKIFTQITSSPENVASLGKLGLLNPAAGVSYVGHSLGAMVGITAANISNQDLGDPAAQKTYFNLNKVALANPGASIPYLLLNSSSFQGLMKSAIAAITNKDFVTQCEGKIPLFCYARYETALINDGTPESLATLTEIYDSYGQFLYSAQTISDTIDPINHAPLVANSLPIYLSQVKNDLIIPNLIPENTMLPGTEIRVPYSPFAGTTPLLKIMALTPVTTSINGQLIKNAALFNSGSHSSLSSAKASPITTEMHTQIRSFINGDGNTLTVNDASLLDSVPY